MANQQVKYTITGENLLSKVLKQVDGDAQKAEDSVKKVSKALSGKDKGSAGGAGEYWKSGIMGAFIQGNLITAGITKVTGALVGFGKSVVDSVVNYEYFSASLKTMLHGDVALSEALQSQLVNLAKTTPFSLVDVQQGTKQLLAYGFRAGELVDTMKMLGDVSAGVGKPLTEVAYLYGTLKTQGRAFSKDINQFATAGIPIIKELAKQFKTTQSNVMKLVEKGKVGFPEVEKAFKSMTAEGSIFFNLMEDQSHTLGGKISALGDVWTQLQVNIGKSQKGILGGTTQFMTDMLTQLNDRQSADNFVDKATGGTSRKDALGWVPSIYTTQEQKLSAYAEFLEKKLASNTGTQQGIGQTAGFISNQLGYLQEQKKIFDDHTYRTAEGLQYRRDKRPKKLDPQLAMGDYGTSNPLDFLQNLQDKRDILMLAQKNLLGAQKLLNSKNEKPNPAKAGSKTDKLGTGVTIESQAPKNQYITINGGLVHQMTIESVDGGFPVDKMKELTETALVELLNDSYQALR